MTYNYLLYSLGSSVVRFSLLMISFQSVFQSSFYILLTLLFARYSPFCCSLSRSSRLILPVLATLFQRIFACLAWYWIKDRLQINTERTFLWLSAYGHANKFRLPLQSMYIYLTIPTHRKTKLIGQPMYFTGT